MQADEELEEKTPDLPDAPETDEETPDFLEVIDDNEEFVEAAEEQEEQKVPPSKKADTRFQRRIDELRAKQGAAEQTLEQERKRSAELERRLKTLEEGIGEKDQLDLQNQYTNTKAALSQAVEEGNTERQIELTEILTDIRAKARTAEAAKTDAPFEEEEGQLPATVSNTPPQDPPPKEAMLWWNRNRWFNGPQFEEESNEARKIDAELEAEGFDREDKSYYEELVKGLNALTKAKDCIFLRTLPYGAKLYDIYGISVTYFDYCIQDSSNEDDLRSLIFQEDGHLNTNWNSEAGRIF